MMFDEKTQVISASSDQFYGGNTLQLHVPRFLWVMMHTSLLLADLYMLRRDGATSEYIWHGRHVLYGVQFLSPRSTVYSIQHSLLCLIYYVKRIACTVCYN